MPWVRALSSWPVEIHAIQLPGRENRLGERSLVDLHGLADLLVEILMPMFDRQLNRRSAFFGHSMGGILAYEVARRMESYSGLSLGPERLFLSGVCPVHRFDGKGQLHRLAGRSFMETIQARYGGIPEEVLQNRELQELIEPMLRADFEMIETYVPRETPALRASFTVFGGIDDPLVEIDSLSEWQRYTQAPIELQTFAGGHFFLQNGREKEKVVREIVRGLGFQKTETAELT